ARTSRACAAMRSPTSPTRVRGATTTRSARPMFFIARAAAPTLPPRRGRTRTTRKPGGMRQWYKSPVRSAIVAVGLDAGGTLVELREPVGETYARHARSLGFAADADGMERGFQLAFAAAPPLAAPRRTSPARRVDFERAWWRSVVATALAHALGVSDPAATAASAFARLFEDLFAHYASAAAWRLFPDSLPALQALARRDLRLGVLSNFDGRLHGLTDRLRLRSYLAAAVASSEAGATKPSAVAFAALAQALGSPPPSACLHVGDSYAEDALGAVASGWHAAWLARDER